MRRAVVAVMSALLLSLLWATPAWALEFYLEGPPLASQAEATAMVQAATAAGYPARVLRRYRPGGGWEYVFVSEGYDGRAAASEAASVIAKQTARGISVYQSDGTSAQRVEEAAAPRGASAPTTLPAANPPTPSVEAPAPRVEAPLAVARPPAITPLDPEADAQLRAWLRHAKRGIATTDGRNLLAVPATNLLMRYRRRLPDGTVVVHTYARRGADLYLETLIESGQGTGAVARVIGEKAWLGVGSAAAVPADRARVLATIDRFAPERVLGPVFGYASILDTPEAVLRLEGVTTVEGQACRVLQYYPQDGGGAVVFAVSERDKRPVQVGYGDAGGPLVHGLSDWKDAGGGLPVPHRVQTWRKEVLVDDVEVLEFDLRPTLPEVWFRPPESSG